MAQAAPTATRSIQPAIFAGFTGSETGLSRNLAFTAGLDLGIRLALPVDLSLEGRGTFPINTGTTDARQRSLLGGLKLSYPAGLLRPYLDLLVGRNQTNYNPGLTNVAGDRYFVQSVSTVFSPGIGIDIGLSSRFRLKIDAQLQHYDSPGSPSGHLYAKPVTIAMVYNIGTGRRPR